MCILKAGPSVGPNPVTGKGINCQLRKIEVFGYCKTRTLNMPINVQSIQVEQSIVEMNSQGV